MYSLEISFQLWRFHTGINRWKSATDIDNINGYRCFDNRRADMFHCIGKGLWRHCLAAYMKADAKAVGNLSCRDKQVSHFGWFCAKFGSQTELSVLR